MTHRSESESNVHRASHSIRRRVKARARAMTRVRLLRACQHIRARVRVREMAYARIHTQPIRVVGWEGYAVGVMVMQGSIRSLLGLVTIRVAYH